ncbi:unnamed protein product [Cuscuta campestris]|uniref:Uncharacterized protein n=1 Tax=Cuscuta campestris TaxID=132261 RepID=A0A484LCM7_9ASTE|nr:unnamed protein product [Cuscuta campestris]
MTKPTMGLAKPAQQRCWSNQQRCLAWATEKPWFGVKSSNSDVGIWTSLLSQDDESLISLKLQTNQRTLIRITSSVLRGITASIEIPNSTLIEYSNGV